MPLILFVCTGNTCRSPMAEYLLKDMLAKEGIEGIEVKSAGIAALTGSKANKTAQKVLSEDKLDLTAHVAKQVDEKLIKEAALILTMTLQQKNMLQKMAGEKKDKIYTLKEYAGLKDDPDIFDPFGQSQKIYQQTRDEIKRHLTSMLGNLHQFFGEEGNNKVVENNIIRSDRMKIAIGSDHAGYDLKEKIKKFLDDEGYSYQDMGTDSDQSVDYPDYAYQVAIGVANREFDRGILICGTGIGMSITANKIRGVRAALCHDVFSAKATRNHNNANVLTIGSRVVGSGLALEIVKTWLGAEFDGGRHKKRISKIDQIERGEYQ